MPQVPSVPSAIIDRKYNMPGSIEIIPEDVAFETQDVDEKVYVKSRPHPIVNVGWITNTTVFGLLPIIYFYFRDLLPKEFDLVNYVRLDVAIILIVSYYLILTTSALISFLDWYFDIYLLTNYRIIKIQFDPLKKYRIGEARLENIEDIRESVVGIIPQLFNYGDLEIRTAAQTERFYFKSVPNPGWFRNAISDLVKYVRDSE